MKDIRTSDKDRRKAGFCLTGCGVCKRAREKQRGFFFWFVKAVEKNVCPYCRAYEKVYGRKAHEPVPEESNNH